MAKQKVVQNMDSKNKIKTKPIVKTKSVSNNLKSKKTVTDIVQAQSSSTNVEAILQLLLAYKAPRPLVTYFQKHIGEKLARALCKLLAKFLHTSYENKEYTKLQGKLSKVANIKQVQNPTIRWTIQRGLLCKNWGLMYKILKLVYNQTTPLRLVQNNETSTSTTEIASKDTNPAASQADTSSDSNSSTGEEPTTGGTQ
jgi:hypothetical protein